MDFFEGRRNMYVRFEIFKMKILYHSRDRSLKNLKYQTFRKFRKVISYRKRILIDDLRIESFGKEIRN